MDINIVEALKFPFKDKNWLKKLAPFIVTYLVFAFAMIGMMILGFVTESNGYDGRVNPMTTAGVGFGFILLILISFIAILIVSLYMSGYMLDTIMMVMRGVRDQLPEHGGQIWRRIKMALYYMLISLAPGLIVLLGMGVLFLPLIIFGTGGELANAIHGYTPEPGKVVLFTLLIILLVFILFAVLLCVGFFIIPSMLYLYLSSGMPGQAFKISAIKGVLSRNWKKFGLLGLLLFAASILIQIVLMPFTLVINFIPLVGPIFVQVLSMVLSVYITFVSAYLYGVVFEAVGKTESAVLNS